MVPSAARTLHHPRKVTGLEQGARLRAARRELLDWTKDALRAAPLFFWHAEVLRHSCERKTVLVTGGLQRILGAIGPKRTSVVAPHMSAFGVKADMPFCTVYVCF